MFGKPRGIEHDLPGEYLLDALFEAGPSEWLSGSEGPISWQTLYAYFSTTHAITEPWEARAVIALSRAYYNAKARGTDPHSIEPVDALHDGIC